MPVNLCIKGRQCMVKIPTKAVVNLVISSKCMFIDLFTIFATNFGLESTLYSTINYSKSVYVKCIKFS